MFSNKVAPQNPSVVEDVKPITHYVTVEISRLKRVARIATGVALVILVSLTTLGLLFLVKPVRNYVVFCFKDTKEHIDISGKDFYIERHLEGLLNIKENPITSNLKQQVSIDANRMSLTVNGYKVSPSQEKNEPIISVNDQKMPLMDYLENDSNGLGIKDQKQILQVLSSLHQGSWAEIWQDMCNLFQDEKKDVFVSFDYLSKIIQREDSLKTEIIFNPSEKTVRKTHTAVLKTPKSIFAEVKINANINMLSGSCDLTFNVQHLENPIAIS